MEVKSKEQKTFTYTLTFNSSELDELLPELHEIICDAELSYPKTHSMYSKLNQARVVDLDDE